MSKKIFLLIIVLFASNTVFAHRTIKGQIKNKESKETMVGVAIYIPELQKGTFSDEQGNYRIDNLPKGVFTFQYSYLGYKTISQEVNIEQEEITLNIELETTYIHSAEVVVSAIGYSSQHCNAIKVESIKAEDLNNGATINIMDKLVKIPGVNMITQGPSISTPNIRGLSLSNVLVLNNGFRMNNYQFSTEHPYLISNYGISKIEVIKGPASLLYGSDAIGGVINYIGERPASVGMMEADINTAYYSNTRGYETNIGVKAHGKQYFWGVRAGMQKHGDYMQGNNEAVPNTRFNDQNVQFNTGINNDFGSFTLRYNYKAARLGLTTPQAIALVDDKGYLNEMWYQDLDYHQLSSHNKFYFKKLKFETNFSYQTNRRTLFATSQHLLDMRLQNADYELKVNFEPSSSQKIVIGTQGNYTQNINNGAPEIVIPNYYQNDFSLFGLYQKDFGHKVHFQGGLRYDYRKMYVPEIINTTIATATNLDTNYKSINFTIGAVFELSEEWFIRTNFASAYRTPNIAELTQDGFHETRYERGNIHLQSQKSYEGDIGLHYHSQMFTFDFSAFYNDIRNYIYIAPSADTTQQGLEIYQYGQTDATIYGLETGINYMPTKQLDLNLNYSYVIGKQKNGDWLPMIPQNRIQGGIRISLKGLDVLKNNFVEINGNYAFKQDHITDHEEASDAYFLLNLGIGTSLKFGNQHFILSIHADNILDTQYMDHLSILREEGFYNMGRNISIKLSIPISGKYGIK